MLSGAERLCQRLGVDRAEQDTRRGTAAEQIPGTRWLRLAKVGRGHPIGVPWRPLHHLVAGALSSLAEEATPKVDAAGEASFLPGDLTMRTLVFASGRTLARHGGMADTQRVRPSWMTLTQSGLRLNQRL